jgi:hypothetical protein
VLKFFISFAAQVAFGISTAVKSTRINFDKAAWTILVIAMYCGLLLALLLLAIGAILEG